MTGVYAIRHTASGRVYVGSSKDIHRRWREHVSMLERGRHNSRHLQHAWAKYGSAAFEFVVFDVCLHEERIGLEQQLIDLHHAVDPKYGFNLTPTAGVTTYTRTAEIKAKISDKLRGRRLSEAALAKRRGRSLSPEHRANISAGGRGKKRSAETRARMSAAKQNVSAETRARISATAGNRPPVSEQTREKQSAAARQRVAQPGAKAKMSAAWTDERRAQQSAWMKAARAAAKQHGLMLVNPAQETVS